MKFKEIIPKFLDYKRDFVRASTLSGYELIYNRHLQPFFGEMSEITQTDVDKYLYEKAQEGYSKKALESHVVALKSLLRWSNDTGVYISKNFKANYPNIAKGSSEINPLTVDQAKLFSRYCEENFCFINLALYTVLFTGIRVAELAGLQWKDIDVDRGVLSVNKIVTRVSKLQADRLPDERNTDIVVSPPKTPNSIREVPLSKKLLSYYKLLKRIVNPEWYVASNKDVPIEPRMIRIELSRIMEKLNLPNIRVHDLRHTFATRCISAGIDPKTVSVMLGHSTVATTLKIYAHTDDAAKTNAINKLSKKMSW